MTPQKAMRWSTSVVDGDSELPPENDDVEARRDPATDKAKDAIRSIFKNEPELVVYHRQFVVWLEKKFFHWITGRALRELVEDNVLRYEELLCAMQNGRCGSTLRGETAIGRGQRIKSLA